MTCASLWGLGFGLRDGLKRCLRGMDGLPATFVRALPTPAEPVLFMGSPVSVLGLLQGLPTFTHLLRRPARRARGTSLDLRVPVRPARCNLRGSRDLSARCMSGPDQPAPCCCSD